MKLHNRLRSVYGALLLVVLGGLIIPAIIGGYLLIGVREQDTVEASLRESLLSYADILTLGIRVEMLFRPPLGLITHVGKQQQSRNGLKQLGFVIDQDHRAAAPNREIDEVLPGPFLSHDLFGQIAA